MKYNVWFKNGKSYRKVNVSPLSETEAKILAARLNQTKVEEWYQYIVRPHTNHRHVANIIFECKIL